MTILPYPIFVIRRFLSLLGIGVGKTCIVPRGDIAQVAHYIHHFVVTEQTYNPAACLWRFFLEGHHQVHDLARLGAAIQEVSDLHECCLAARPVVLLVRKTGALENGDKAVKVVMNIADSNYGFRWIRWSTFRSRPRYHRQQQDHDEINTKVSARDP